MYVIPKHVPIYKYLRTLKTQLQILTDFENATTFSIIFFELWKANILMLYTTIKQNVLSSCWYENIPNRLARYVDNVILSKQPKY